MGQEVGSPNGAVIGVLVVPIEDLRVVVVHGQLGEPIIEGLEHSGIKTFLICR